MVIKRALWDIDLGKLAPQTDRGCSRHRSMVVSSGPKRGRRIACSAGPEGKFAVGDVVGGRLRTSGAV